MIVDTSRFGKLEISQEALIQIPGGLVGFSGQQLFAWVPHKNSQQLAWLQSATNPAIAFPILNAARFVEEGYPDVPIQQIAELGGVSYSTGEELALMVVLSASELAPPTVNLMAPIVINIETRMGAQVVLVNTRFTTALLTPRPSAPAMSAVTAEGP